MRLKPFLEENEVEDKIVKSAIEEALTLTGFQKGKSAKMEIDEIRRIFDDNGAGIEDVAKMSGALLRGADKEETRLRAGELALRVQGVFKEIDDKQIPQIIINVQGDENQTLINLVCPVS